MRELGIVLPFQMGKYRIRDMRTVSALVRGRVVQLRKDTIGLWPHDLLCRCETGREADALALNRARGSEQDTETVKQRIQAINKDGVRSTLDEYLGEMSPINFVIERDGEFFGGWQIFGIRILSDGDEEFMHGYIKLRGTWWPAFPVRASALRVARLAMEIGTEFLDRQLPLADGGVLDVERWELPVVIDVGRGAELDVVSIALNEAAERVEIVDEHTDIAGQQGRQLLRMTRSSAPRQTRDDPFDTSRSAPRPSRSGDNE